MYLDIASKGVNMARSIVEVVAVADGQEILPV